MLRAQLNKPNTHTKSGTHAGRETPLVGLRGRRRERRSQAEGQRTKVGEESVDGIPVRRAAKRPPELEEVGGEVGLEEPVQRLVASDRPRRLPLPLLLSLRRLAVGALHPYATQEEREATRSLSLS